MNYQESKLVGLQKDVTLLITIATSTTLDSAPERVLFFGLDKLINTTLDSMFDHAKDMVKAELMSECRLEEWIAVLEPLRR